MKKILFIFTLAFITTSVNANSLLIKNVDVYKSNGMEPNTNVLIKNGEIVAIGKRIYETADRDIAFDFAHLLLQLQALKYCYPND